MGMNKKKMSLLRNFSEVEQHFFSCRSEKIEGDVKFFLWGTKNFFCYLLYCPNKNFQVVTHRLITNRGAENCRSGLGFTQLMHALRVNKYR